MGDDNAAASANMRAGLSGLGNFVQALREWQVQKPQIEANTAATQAATAAQQQNTQQQGQLFNGVTLPQAQLGLSQQQQAADLVKKNLYLDTVQKPTSQDLQTAAQPPITDDPNIAPPAPATTPDIDPSVPFIQQAPGVQEAMIQHVMKHTPSTTPVTHDEAASALATRDYRDAVAKLPPVNYRSLPEGMHLKDLKQGKDGLEWDAVSSAGAQPILNPDGSPSGFVTINGETKQLPESQMMSPKDRTAMQSEINGIGALQNQISEAKGILQKNPKLVGKGLFSGGGMGGNAAREAEAYAGNPKDYAQQRKLEMFLTRQMLDTLSQVHTGRVTELEWNQLKNNIPKMDDPKENWNDYLDKLSALNDKALQQRQETLKQYGGGLPDVNSAASKVTPPQASTARVGDSDNGGSTGSVGDADQPVQVNSKAEAQAALKAGKQFLYKGKVYGK